MQSRNFLIGLDWPVYGRARRFVSGAQLLPSYTYESRNLMNNSIHRKDEIDNRYHLICPRWSWKWLSTLSLMEISLLAEDNILCMLIRKCALLTSVPMLNKQLDPICMIFFLCTLFKQYLMKVDKIEDKLLISFRCLNLPVCRSPISADCCSPERQSNSLSDKIYAYNPNFDSSWFVQRPCLNPSKIRFQGLMLAPANILYWFNRYKLMTIEYLLT